MSASACPHADAQTPRRMCVHLLPVNDAGEHAFRFTGRGTEFFIVCRACADATELELAPACDACWRECEDDVGSYFGVRGAPEVRCRESDIRFAHRDTAVAALIDAHPVAFAPLTDGAGSSWLALSSTGSLLRVDLDEARVTSVAHIDLSALGPSPQLRVHASHDGRFAAVVAAHGSNGVVLDLATGTTMKLDRGAYQVQHCEFSVAFARDGGRTLIVHATDWNRLDVSDPSTGETLTARGPTSYREGEPRPANYLDYCHSGLTVSPDGRWLVDDGWVWHPRGLLRSLDLRSWVHENPWESEDGPTVQELRWCEYFWDAPKCFIDDRTLAVWGYGSDGEAMVDAAVLFDVETGKRLRWFAGPPRGRFWFDRHLLVAAEGKGTSVWDVATGERLHEDRDFVPIAHNAAARTFLSVLPGGVLRESRLTQE